MRNLLADVSFFFSRHSKLLQKQLYVRSIAEMFVPQTDLNCRVDKDGIVSNFFSNLFGKWSKCQLFIKKLQKMLLMRSLKQL